MAPTLSAPAAVRCRYCGQTIDSDLVLLNRHIVSYHQGEIRERQRALEPLLVASFFESEMSPERWHDYRASLLPEPLYP